MREILDIFGIDMRLLLVQAFNFGVLLLALWYFLYRPVTAMLEERRRVAERGVRDAEAAARERRKTEDKKRDILSAAAREAETVIERARKHVEEEEGRLLKRAEEKSEQLVKEASLRADEERRIAFESGKEEIARMAVLGAAKILEEQNRQAV